MPSYLIFLLLSELVASISYQIALAMHCQQFLPIVSYVFATESITCFIHYLVRNQTSTSVVALSCRCPMPTQTIIFPQSSVYPPTVLCLPIVTCTCHKMQYCDGETLVSLKSQYGGGEKSDELLHNCNHQYQYGCLDMLKIENLCIILN